MGSTDRKSKPGGDEFLTTGQAARLCSVTRDTVLKWIKRGSVEVIRTAGGHYRIPRAAFERLVPLTGVETPTPNKPVGPRRRFQFCWEFFAKNGEIARACFPCLVFKARAMRCWEMSALSQAHGFVGTYCETSCEDCGYLEDQRSRPYHVLVITDCQKMKAGLLEESQGTRYVLRFSSCDYETSALVDEFRPDYVVIDCLIEENRCVDLCANLTADHRVPGVRILLATVEGKPVLEQDSRVHARLPRPLKARELEAALDYSD